MEYVMPQTQFLICFLFQKFVFFSHCGSINPISTFSLPNGRIGEIYPLHGSDDHGRGQSEDDDAVGRMECSHQTPTFSNDNVSVSQDGKRDRRKIEGRLHFVDRACQHTDASLYRDIHRRQAAEANSFPVSPFPTL